MINNIKLVVNLFLASMVWGGLLFRLINKKNNIYIKKICASVIIIGTILSILGIVLNLVVVNANQDKMPVSLEKGQVVEDFRHQEINEETKYKVLADNYYLAFPCKGMYSIGDIIAGIGIIITFGTIGIVILLVKKKIV